MYIELYIYVKNSYSLLSIVEYIFHKNVYLTDVKLCLSLVDFVLTLVDSEFMGVSMVATQGLSGLIKSLARVVTAVYSEIMLVFPS